VNYINVIMHLYLCIRLSLTEFLNFTNTYQWILCICFN